MASAFALFKLNNHEHARHPFRKEARLRPSGAIPSAAFCIESDIGMGPPHG